MSAGVTLTMTGMDALRLKLAKLDPKTSRKIMSRALRIGARPIRKVAVAKAKSITDPSRKRQPNQKQLYRTIAVRAAKKRQGHTEVSVKIITGPLGHLVEFGTGERVGGSRSKSYKGRTFGSMTAQPFLRPAFDAQKNKGLADAAAEVERGITEALK